MPDPAAIGAGPRAVRRIAADPPLPPRPLRRAAPSRARRRARGPVAVEHLDWDDYRHGYVESLGTPTRRGRGGDRGDDAGLEPARVALPHRGVGRRALAPAPPAGPDRRRVQRQRPDRGRAAQRGRLPGRRRRRACRWRASSTRHVVGVAKPDPAIFAPALAALARLHGDIDPAASPTSATRRSTTSAGRRRPGSSRCNSIPTTTTPASSTSGSRRCTMSSPGSEEPGGTRPGDHVSPAWAAWRRSISVEDYEARFERLLASGASVHGEADFVESLGPRRLLDAGCGTGRMAIELDRRASTSSASTSTTTCSPPAGPSRQACVGCSATSAASSSASGSRWW